MRKISIFFIITFALLSGCGESPVKIESVEFGSFSGKEEIKFLPKTTFSRAHENNYGWLVIATPVGAEIEVIEEIEAPVPTTWGEPTPSVQISENNLKATTTRTMAISKGGFIFSNWSTLPTDPIGIYKAKLIIKGKVVKETLFTVE